MSKAINVDEEFLRNQVKAILKEVSYQDSEVVNFTGKIKDSFVQDLHSLKRWTNKKLFYSNDRKQAVARIESDDPEVIFIKSFFNLFTKTCYKSSDYSEYFDNAWASEDPGTYCLENDAVANINKWYKESRQKSIKQLMVAEDSGKRLEILEVFADDLRSELNSFFDSFAVIVSEERARPILKILASDEKFINNWREQWHGHGISPIDCFVSLFSFVHDLHFNKSSAANASDIYRLGNLVSNSGDWSSAMSGALEKIKRGKFVKRLRRSTGLRNKWSGFCANMLFDPYGEKPLDHWISKSEVWKNNRAFDHKDMWAGAIVGLSEYIAIERTLMAALRSGAARVGVSAIGGLPVFIVSTAVFAFCWWDPFEWFSIRDNLEEEFRKILGSLEEAQKLTSSVESNKLTDKKSETQPADPVEPEGQKDISDAAKLASLFEGTSTTQNDLDSIRETIQRSLEEIISLLQNKLEEKMQSNITADNDNLSQKIELGVKMQSHLQSISDVINKLSLKESDLDNSQEEISNSIEIIHSFLQQSKKDGQKVVYLDKKLKQDVGLGKTLSDFKGIRESRILVSESESGEGLHDKWSEVIYDTYGVNVRDVEALSRAREIRDRDEINPGLELLLNELNNPVAQLNEQVKSFEDWWTIFSRSGGGVVDNPKITSEFTILHRAWVNNPNGLRSEEDYETDGEIFKKASGLFAICGIGLGHSLVNTSFYYFAGPARGWPIMKERSRVEITGDAVSLIDKGPLIQRLRSIVSGTFMNNYNTKMKEINDYVNWLIRSDAPIDLKKQYTAANILITLYYKRELKFKLKKVSRLIELDEEFSKSMESDSLLLASLPAKSQNKTQHAALMSRLRVSAARKIMLFEALMTLE